MIRELLRARASVLGCLAAIALIGLSATAVRAGVPMPQQQRDKVDQKVARAQYEDLLAKAMAQAKYGAWAGRQAGRQLALAKALVAARLQEVQERLRVVQDDDEPRRLRVRSPRMEAVRDRILWRGGNSVDAILAQSEELELTDDQEASIRAAQRAARRAEIGRDAEIEVAQLDLEDLLEDEYTADLDAVEAKMGEISNLRVAARLADLRLRRDVHEVLTPEQREQLEEHDNVWFFRSGDGPSALMFGREEDGFRFAPHEMLKRFEIDGDFPFEVFEFRGKRGLHEESEKQEQEGHEGASEPSATSRLKGPESIGPKSKGVETL